MSDLMYSLSPAENDGNKLLQGLVCEEDPQGIAYDSYESFASKFMQSHRKILTPSET